MVAPTLVETQIEDGRAIISQLDADNFPIDAALWYYDTEKEKWVLLIATPLVKSLGRKESYAKIKASLDRLHGRIKTQILDMTLTSPDHNIVVRLKSALRPTPGVPPTRFVSNLILGTATEDALVYRIRK